MPDNPINDNKYELSDEQKVEFRSAAYWIGFMGRLLIIIGVLMCLGILTLRIGLFIQGIIAILIGKWTTNVASDFRRIAENTDQDSKMLIEAIVNLKKLYRLQVIITVIAVFVILVLSVVTLMFPIVIIKPL